MDHTFGQQPDAQGKDEQVSIGDVVEEYMNELDDKIADQIHGDPMGTDRKLTKYTLSAVTYQPTAQSLPEEIPSPVITPAFSFNSSFSQVKNFLLEDASKKNMEVIRNDQICLMVGKKKKRSFFPCLFSCCWNSQEESERDIYELARVKSRRKPKAIFKQISGNDQGFQAWKQEFMSSLWKKKILQPNLYQAVGFSLQQKSQQVQILCTLYSQSLVQFDRHNSLELLQHELQTLMGRVHELEKSLQKILSDRFHFILDPEAKKLLHCELFKKLNLSTIYTEAFQKEGQKLEERKSIIKRQWSIKSVLKELEMDDDDQQNLEKKICQLKVEELPYYELIIYLDSLNLEGNPLSEIGKISTFCSKLQALPSQKALIEMDNQLPLIILCCLLSSNKKLKESILLLFHYWQKSEHYQFQKRILAAINGSLQFIKKQWKQCPMI